MGLLHYWRNKRNNRVFHACHSMDTIMPFLRNKTLKELEALTYSPLLQPLHYRAVYLRRFELTGRYPHPVYHPDDYEYVEAYIQEQTRIAGHPPRLALSVLISVLGPRADFFTAQQLQVAFQEHIKKPCWNKLFFTHTTFTSDHISQWLMMMYDYQQRHKVSADYLVEELTLLAHHYTLDKHQQIQYGLLCYALGDIAYSLFGRYHHTTWWPLLGGLSSEERYRLLFRPPADDSSTETTLFL